MRRYIDAEDVEKRIDIVMGSEPKAWDKKALRELKMYVVHALPTADVVEVVRCKDCIYKEECGREVLVNEYDNDKAVDITGFLFYCSYGERAEKC